MRLLLSTVAASLLTAGCATFVPVDGYQMFESAWNDERAEISRRAAFDLKCDEAALRLSVLKASCNGDKKACVAEQVGVRGCDRQAVYVNVGHTGWVMNNERGTE